MARVLRSKQAPITEPAPRRPSPSASARVGKPITYLTLEVNFNNWCIAHGNLGKFPFVDCRWGCSVDRNEAIALIRKDEAIRNHQNYPDIFIDDTEDPVGFYSNELHGVLGAPGQIGGKSPVSRLARACEVDAECERRRQQFRTHQETMERRRHACAFAQAPSG